tara:strand:+ start:3028 stop:3270 length:243 start_codon:yes stop_codon:yes gene_type:complete
MGTDYDLSTEVLCGIQPETKMKKIQEIIDDIKLSLFLSLGKNLCFDEVTLHASEATDNVISVKFTNTFLERKELLTNNRK